MEMNKIFSPVNFTWTKWSTAAEKAKFATQFVKFVESDFDAAKFPRWFYTRLSMCFGMIAHFDQAGFYATYFTSPQDKVAFLQEIDNWPCHGDPGWTFSDVERTLQNWIRESGILVEYKKKLEAQS